MARNRDAVDNSDVVEEVAPIVARPGEVVLRNSMPHDIDLCYVDENKQPQRVTVPAGIFEGNGNVLVSSGSVTISKELHEQLMKNQAINTYFSLAYLSVA